MIKGEMVQTNENKDLMATPSHFKIQQSSSWRDLLK